MLVKFSEYIYDKCEFCHICLLEIFTIIWQFYYATWGLLIVNKYWYLQCMKIAVGYKKDSFKREI